jgi:hypothetical protein
MESAIIGVLIIGVVLCGLVWFVWSIGKGIIRWFSKSKPVDSARTESSPLRQSSLPKSRPAPQLIEMPEATSRLFTYEDERRAAQACQRLWMRYEDRQGNITERTVEIYQPEDDEVIFAWCGLAHAPRTFARRSIQSWRLLPDRFVFDPVINQYWEEEGVRDLSEKIPWRRWLEDQPDEIARRYE